MNSSIVISAHVINTINALPEEERLAIAGALAGEMLLGARVEGELTPMQSMLYTIIRDNIRRDSHKYSC